ncbi:MAG: PAS domain S-box protein, partial [Gammaproteobacteria bacterium]|nr:PAS domain S-box protein [Gammaproteobacteria bacterium]
MTFKKTAVYISLSVLLICSTLIWYGYSLVARVSNIESLWLGYNQNATAASYALSRISSNFGFGGFIHNYKNYILHQNEALVPVIEDNLLNTLEAVEDYLKLDITEEEKKALRRLEHHIDIYAAKFEFARSLVGRGLAPREVEINVQVNDTPAFEAIEFLSKYALSRGKSAETETDASLSKTLRFLQWGALSIPFIIFVGLLVVFFVKRIVLANSRLSDAQKYADDLIEFAPNAWLIINGAGQVIRANSQSSAMFGYSRDEFIGMPIETIIPERYQKHHVALRDEYIDQPTFKSLEERGAELIAQDKRGREFPVEINLGYTYKEGAINVVSAIRDISSRRKIEERQRLAEKIFENATDAILILDTGMHILDMNKAFVTISDIKKQNYIGQYIDEFSKTCFGGKIFQDVATGLSEEGRYRGEWRLRDREGRECVFLFSAGGVK